MKKIKREQLLTVGYIMKTHGLLGAFNVKIVTDFPELRFVEGNTFYLLNKETRNYDPFTLETVKIHTKRLLLTFTELTSIEEAEKYVKSELLIAKEESKLPESFIYLSDLATYTVYLEDTTFVGEITEILETASYYTLRVKRENKHDLLIPFIDEFIIETNTEQKKIIFRPIEGML